MKETLPLNAALIVTDVQKAFDNPGLGPRNNPQAERNIRELLDRWRATGRPVFHIKHNSKNPESYFRRGKVGNEFKEETRPVDGETVVEKDVNSAFIGTDLEQRLRKAGIETLVVTGLSTDHCVSTTVRMAGNLGFRTIVVADGTAAFDRVGHDGKRYLAELIHQTALASLSEEFAEVLDTEEVLARTR